MRCPICGSENITSQAVTETHTKAKTKGFGWFKACFGFLLFNIPGVLCGLCGMGKERRTTTTKTRVLHICQNCGNQW